MRAIAGQMSDNRPIQRNREQKQRQLRELKETLAGMKSHTSPSLRASLTSKIAALEAELGGTKAR
ncbi:hypothetical protein IAI18_18380 [Acetobacteraceae bacterium H6797]|nr:hypothetical protein [Acetobacteraceae bacterium H6797]